MDAAYKPPKSQPQLGPRTPDEIAFWLGNRPEFERSLEGKLSERLPTVRSIVGELYT
jgi:hypothetical protein